MDESNEDEPLNPNVYDSFTDENKREFLSKFKLIKSRKLTYDERKPIVIVYNPNSGKKLNLLPLIEGRLNQEGISFELMPTQQYLDTYNFARTMDLSKYSVLCCCGGDGSYHETVNGMLDREDKIKIPVAFLPNGSGNDLCRSLGYTTLDQGLSYIIKA